MRVKCFLEREKKEKKKEREKNPHFHYLSKNKKSYKYLHLQKIRRVYTDTDAGYFKINNHVSSHLRLQIKKKHANYWDETYTNQTGVSYVKW